MAGGIPTDPSAFSSWLGLKIDKPILREGKVMTVKSMYGILNSKLKFGRRGEGQSGSLR